MKLTDKIRNEIETGSEFIRVVEGSDIYTSLYLGLAKHVDRPEICGLDSEVLNRDCVGTFYSMCGVKTFVI